MPLSYLGLVSCFSPSWVPSGCTVGLTAWWPQCPLFTWNGKWHFLMTPPNAAMQKDREVSFNLRQNCTTESEMRSLGIRLPCLGRVKLRPLLGLGCCLQWWDFPMHSPLLLDLQISPTGGWVDLTQRFSCSTLASVSKLWRLPSTGC